MKRLLKGIIFIIFAVCLVGCSKDGSDISKLENTEKINIDSSSVGVYSQKYSMISLSEIGAIWNWGNQRLIKFSPVDSGEIMPLCYDPNCKHPETSDENPDPVCMAALYNHNCEIAYYNGAVYIFERRSLGENELYKMNINGSSREYIGTFPFEVELYQESIFCNNKAYLKVGILETNLEEVEGIQALEYTDKFVEIDLINGTYRYISDEIEDYIADIDLMNDKLFLRLADQKDGGRLYMMKLDIKTSESEIFISKDEWAAGCKYILAYDNDSYLYWDKNTSEIGIKNLDGTVEKLLLKGPEGESFRVCSSCDGMMYRRTMEYEGSVPGNYFMDFETGEIINITDEVEKYNLIYYDGYYDMFLGNIEDENNKILGRTAWSKAKILGEAME